MKPHAIPTKILVKGVVLALLVAMLASTPSPGLVLSALTLFGVFSLLKDVEARRAALAAHRASAPRLPSRPRR